MPGTGTVTSRGSARSSARRGRFPGVRGAAVYPGCVDRENRYHVLIELEMEPSALTTYDESAMHHRWKDEFGPLLEKKAIFDYER